MLAPAFINALYAIDGYHKDRMVARVRFTHPPTHSLTPSLTHSLTHACTHSLTCPLTQYLTHPLTHPHTRPTGQMRLRRMPVPAFANALYAIDGCSTGTVVARARFPCQGEGEGGSSQAILVSIDTYNLVDQRSCKAHRVACSLVA